MKQARSDWPVSTPLFGKLPVAKGSPSSAVFLVLVLVLRAWRYRGTSRASNPLGILVWALCGASLLPERRAVHRPYRGQPQCGVSITYTVRAAGNARLALSEFQSCLGGRKHRLLTPVVVISKVLTFELRDATTCSSQLQTRTQGHRKVFPTIKPKPAPRFPSLELISPKHWNCT